MTKPDAAKATRRDACLHLRSLDGGTLRVAEVMGGSLAHRRRRRGSRHTRVGNVLTRPVLDGRRVRAKMEVDKGVNQQKAPSTCGHLTNHKDDGCW